MDELDCDHVVTVVSVSVSMKCTLGFQGCRHWWSAKSLEFWLLIGYARGVAYDQGDSLGGKGDNAIFGIGALRSPIVGTA